jgi:hypothetical protein
VELEVEESTFPIISARWRGPLTDTALRAMLVRLDDWLSRGVRFGLLIDSRGSPAMTPEQRRVVVAHMKRNKEKTAAFLVQAVVNDNVVSRTLYWAVQLLAPAPFPSRVFDDPEEARQWLLKMLEEPKAR